MKQLVKILDAAQKAEAEHLKGLQSLSKLYKKNVDQFKTEFIPILQRLLITAQNDPSIDRLITFIAKFVSNQSSDDLIDYLVGYLVDTTRVVDKTVRLRSCQLISSIMSNLPAETEISDDTFENISERIVPRLRDKLPLIRIEAVKALTRLQDPNTEGDAVVEGYIKLLGSDSNKEVRKVTLKNISPTTVTLPHIIKRTRDTSPEVRALVYKILVDYPVKWLDIDQRIALLRNGLGDRESTVKTACVAMILNGWLKSQGDDLVKLLGYLLVECFEDTAEKVIKIVLRNCEISWTPPKVSRRNSLPILSPESTILWKIYLYCLKKRLPKEPAVQDLLDRATPAIPQFCSLLKANEMIAKHLVGMVEYLELTDEAGRRELSDVLRKLLPSPRIAETLKKNIMKTLKLLHEDEDTYITVILEIISEIQDPLEASQVLSQEEFPFPSTPTTPTTPTTPNSKRNSLVRGPSVFNLRSSSSNLRVPESPRDAPLRRASTTSGSLTPRGDDLQPHGDWLSYTASDKLASLQELRIKFAKDGDHGGLHRVDREIEILSDKSDDDKLTSEERRWVHCMAITEELLQLTTKDLENPGIHDLLSNVILRYVTHTMPRIRERAMRCLGLFCMLSKDVARSYLHLFSQALTKDQLQIQCVVLKLLFDLLLVYGMDGFEEIESSQKQGPDSQKSGDNHSVIVSMLCGFLLHESAELRAIVVEGFCKLMYSDQICDPKILSNLVVLFFLSEPSEALEETKKSNNDLDASVLDTSSSPYAHIRQCLSVFLPAYSFQSLGMHSVLSAFIPTIRETTHNMEKYLHGPDDDVQVVKVSSVAQLFVHLTSTKASDGVSCPHNELAIKLAKEILADPQDSDCLKLCRVFKDLHLSRHPASIKTLKFFITTLIEDAAVRKVLTKFLEEVQKLDPVPDVEPTATAIANLMEEINAHTKERQEYIQSKRVLFSPPKKRTKRVSMSDSECDEGEKKISPVVKRNMLGRESKKQATSKIGELADNMRSLKRVLASDEEEEGSEEEGESKSTRSTTKRKTRASSRNRKSKATGEEEDEVEEEEEKEADEAVEEVTGNTKGRSRRRKPAEVEVQIVVVSSRTKATKEEDGEDSADEPPKKKQMRKRGKQADENTESDSHAQRSAATKRKRGAKESESDTGSSSTESPKKRASRGSKKVQQELSDESESHASESDKEEQTRVTRQLGKGSNSKTGDAKQNGQKTQEEKRTTRASTRNGKQREEESDDEVVVTGSNSPRRSTRVKAKEEAQEEAEEEEEEVKEEVEEEEEEETEIGDSEEEKEQPRVTRSKSNRGKEKEKEEDEAEEEEEEVSENVSDSDNEVEEEVDESDLEQEKKRREETAKNTRINSQLLALSQSRNIVVAFAEDTPKGDVTKLAKLVEQLNGKVYSGTSLYSPDITHVVEGQQPAPKMLFAIVTNRWLVSANWIRDSAAQGAFVSETEYGVKCKNPILKRSFYLDASLKESSDRRRLDLINSLLKVGRATVTDDQADADFVLVGPKTPEKKGKGKGKKRDERVYQWDEFVCFMRDSVIED